MDSSIRQIYHENKLPVPVIDARPRFPHARRSRAQEPGCDKKIAT
jgi:hypothetical protein